MSIEPQFDCHRHRLGRVCDRYLTRIAILILLCLMYPSRGVAQTQQDAIAEFKRMATSLASEPPFDCNADRLASRDVHQTEDFLFAAAAEAIVQGRDGESGNSLVTAEEVLRNLVSISDVADASWPIDNRFRYRVLDLKPMLLVQFSIRSSGSFAAFGVPEKIGRSNNTNWMRLTY